MIITRSVCFSSDPEGCGLAYPAVQALPSLGGGQEALPVGHDPVVQQQQGEQEDRATGDYPDHGFISWGFILQFIYPFHKSYKRLEHLNRKPFHLLYEQVGFKNYKKLLPLLGFEATTFHSYR